MTRILLALAGLALSAVAWAQEPEQDQANGWLQAPEAAPSPIVEGAIEPDITIRESGEQTVYEYRVRGVLYMIKVQPQFGPPYYLFDSDGDGMMDVRDTSARNMAVPQWLLFSWD